MIPKMFMLLGFLFLTVGGLLVGLSTGRGEVLFVTSGVGIALFMIGLIGYLKTRTTAYDMEPTR